MAEMNTASTQALQKLEEQLTCSICYGQFINPKFLPCFHSFCLQCLEGVASELVEGNFCLPCPTCKLPCPVLDEGLASLPPSFLVNSLSEVYGLMKKVSGDQQVSCDNCDKTITSHYCKQCSMFFCTECLNLHDKFKPHVTHETLNLDEVASSVYQLPQAKPSAASNCIDHNKPKERFCETCEKLICEDCTMQEKHKDHICETVTEAYRKHHDMVLSCSLPSVKQELNRLSQDKTSLVKKRKEITEQGVTTQKEIRLAIIQMKRLLDETERKLYGDVDVALQHKLSVLDHQMQKVEIALSQLVSCRDHLEQSFKVNTPQQVLSAKSQVMSHTENVLSRVKDKTFQPLEEADIELVKSDKTSQMQMNVGKVKCTLFVGKVMKVSYPNPVEGQKSSIALAFDGSFVPVPPSLISCSLTLPDNSQPVQCSVKESRQSGQYNVVFTPVNRGLHQLHVRVQDIEIPGSPLSILVSVPPEKKDVPLKTITGLTKPSGIAMSNNGLVIVSERGAHCITILDKEGKKIRSIGWNGSERGQLWYPEGVAISAKGNILVADSCNHRIQEFTMDGRCVSCVGSKGNGLLQFKYPQAIAVNKTTEKVYVAEYKNSRVQVLNSNLKFNHKFGSQGSEKGQFKFPIDIVVDRHGFVYVADRDNHRVQKFTPEGQFVCLIGTKGSKPGQLHYPSGITVDDNDLVYVSDENDFVSIFKASGDYLCRIQKHCNEKDCKISGRPTLGVSCSTSGDLYVCCHKDGKIKLL